MNRETGDGADNQTDNAADGHKISTDDTLAVSDSSEPFGQTMPAFAPDPLPSTTFPRVERKQYEIGAELARGGMGRILHARDRRLGRPVVVKELLAQNPRAAARFVREAALTARLQHPGIVPIYEAGTWEDGAPFYAMKLVEGRSLGETISDAASLRDRLALLPNMVAAADALAYAHSRRVIHRDLKPANVIVGAYGETVVIDWGLGKDLTVEADEDPLLATSTEGDESLTVVGSAMGTPAYMPPEQARGLDVDETADVYALGAMLYHLLSGQRPYTGTQAKSADAALAAVAAAPPKPLAVLAPDAPPDLLAIVDKAMARKRIQRYQTAGELAEDLKRYATGQLVGAHRYSMWDLLRRWVGRHRTSMVVAVAAAVALIAGGLVSVQRIRAERTTAEEQRQLAEQNREEVEGLLDFMLSDLRSKLEPIGKLEVLDMVAEQAVDYYGRRPLDDEEADETHKRATALATFADVLWRQGERDAALVHFRSALALRRQLVEQAPSNTDWKFGLSHILFKLGDMLYAAGEIENALAHYEESQRVREELAAREPDHYGFQHALAAGEERLGNVHQSRGEMDQAFERFQKALAILEGLTKRKPDDRDTRRDLAAVQSSLAYVLQVRGDVKGALGRYRSALKILDQLVRDDPGRPAWQHDLAILHTNVGDIENALGRLEPALGEYRAALVMLERLGARDPRNAAWQRDLAAAHSKVGLAEQLRGDLDVALAAQRRAAAIREELSKRDPDDVGWQRNLANSYVLLAGLLAARGEEAESRALANKCGAIYAATARGASHFYNAACCFSLAGDRDRAFEMLGQCVDRGFGNAAALEQDSDMSALHSDARWQSLIDRVRERKRKK